ncbi:aKG-HExxH-type peptide beta-hydroxylase [Streptomyces sp. NBC_00859]|uniref:aKG-HExxH-type peptide beta-hydroxylase n=1 Tax=Streptomyces sp. NBC_00859 TaxID=2903682 RepID=UPI003868CB1A|nr:HEXXH motif-containing putative peptide modification protein [Streptomyces sp. NBC_00859]WSZ86710.1 HEXXH motif-containing putative peptide modification protein [Streptomyces sp. NBC_00859]
MSLPVITTREMFEGLTHAVITRRGDRRRRLLASLRSVAPHTPLTGDDAETDAFDNALVHHVFQQVQAAVATRDGERVARALRLWQNRDALRAQAIATAVGPVLVVSAEQCTPVQDDRLGSRMYLLDAPEPLPGPEREQLALTLNTAIDAALAVGAEVLRSSTAVVIRTGEVALGETCRSYTFDFLPGTVVSNWSGEPLRLAETLVHEATHSWLNECLESEEVEFPPGTNFHSPWKGEERPAFGITHAALAFAHVIQYLSRVQPDAGDHSRLAAVLRRRWADELDSLNSGRDAAEQCFDMVSSERLRAYLRAAVADAHRPA